ncbi:Receptor-type tyrosine-protein phosphatase U [Galemys pyrenaicus]|uniref:Receptor-type tyrosine-protein phosphatase U n=1 Tax=Galemys pyrenaicus TaxID=202257 RepID=A0A8J5ZY08_GALPY|nr:Receptor-type tyrosine-protein phosphatase U [Galemys pyrenaicus]
MGPALAAGCTFEEASDPAVPCEYSQAQYDDFQWEQVRTHPGTRTPADLPHGSYLMVNASQHGPGQRAHIIFQSLSENDTHCVQFSYFLYSRDGHSPGTLGIYVRVNGGPLGSAVWNMTGSHGRQWHQAELAVSTFWPNEYQVLFEALISPDRRGYMGLDDILLLSYPCAKAPHFSRLGDVEVNAGQNASFQCMAAGRAAEAERFLLQRQSGALVPAASVRHISHRRFLATFPLVAVGPAEQDLYRCVSQAPRGAGVSNFAELIVKEPPTPIAPPQLLRAGPTYLIIQLNTNSIIGDGPIVRKEIEYRMARGPWAEVHAVSLQTYKLWHLDPDTEYEISVLLTRPGDGGTGRPGPPLISRTKCAGNRATGQPGNRATGQPGNRATGQPGNRGTEGYTSRGGAARGRAGIQIQPCLTPEHTLPAFNVLLSSGGQNGNDFSQLTDVPLPRLFPFLYILLLASGDPEPMRAPKGLAFAEIQARQLTLQWEPLGYNVTRCHTYTVSLCYHYTLGSSHNQTVRECLQMERGVSQHTIRNLLPYRDIHVRLILTNPEGRKEGREVTFQTDEDVPGRIAAESLTFTPLEDMIFLKWEEPQEPNGLITQYEISYQSIESSDPAVNVPGPRRTISKLRNETYHVFSNLHPGTTYLFSVRARTGKGFGQAALTEITTNISAPSFDYADMPSPLGESENTITVLLRPAQGRGAPVSVYQVVVKEERPRRLRREPGGQDCFPVPLTFDAALARGLVHYFGAELAASSLPEAMPFTVGDNQTYRGFWNPPLEPRKAYLIYFQATSHLKGETRLNCIRIARKAACKESKRPLEVSQRSEEMGLILGICAGGLAVLILLLGAIIVIIRKGKPVNMTKATVNYRQEKTHMMSAVDRSFTDQSTLQEDERLGLSFMDTHGYSPRGDQRSGGVTEASSLLGGSPRRPCGRKGSPYHTGQLHPAVRVADLLQHINQMKTAEGYGFKQEYEVHGPSPDVPPTDHHFPFWQSFFEGWDATKKKDKVKGSRQEPIPAYDRHRVKLHPMLGDPDADYINANYIDGYHKSNHFIATQGPKPEMIYDFWRMVWQEHCSSIVMITKLVEVGRVKCSRYWPDDSDMYGDIKITLVKTETLAEYVVRTFALERRGYSARHEVHQFHFTAWPEHGVPYHATGLLAFIRRVKASTPPDAGPIVIHCSAGTGRTGCYIVLDVMLDMAECEGVVDIYNCVKTLCSRRVNMIQTEEQYIFIHDAILEACLCGETTIPVSEFKATYKEMVRIDPQSNSSQLREEFQTLNSVTPPLDVEECSIALLPRNRDKNRSMDVLPPDRCLPFLISADGDPNNYINAALTDSYTQSAAFIVTLHPLQSTTPDFWRLVYDYGCTSIVMLNQLHQSNSAWPCPQYWPEPGRQQYGLMEVEFVSGTADEDLVARVFRVQNISRLQEGHLLVRHFQFLRWSAYRDTPDSKKAFLHLLAEVDKWQAESGDGRTVVHCLNGGGRSGTFCACATVLEMIRCHNLVDVFFAAKTLRNYKPNMVETLDQYHFCYDVALEYLEGLETR